MVLTNESSVKMNIPPATLPKLSCYYMTLPPPKSEKQGFSTTSTVYKIFWEKIFTHYKNKKCCFRFRLSHALTRVFILYVEKKLKHKTVYPPPKKRLFFNFGFFHRWFWEKESIHVDLFTRLTSPTFDQVYHDDLVNLK